MPEFLQQALTEAIAGTYRVERELGRGGMARVYLAHDLRHDRPVAIKVLLPELSLAISADRFEQEIRIVSRLTHPNIVGLIGSGMLDYPPAARLPYYVMHYVDGESLRDRLLREGPLPVEDAIRIGGEVADALQFAHDRGVIHRDIKPENILLQAGHAMVADFGVARLVASRQTTQSDGAPIGTPAYMSPEQWSGDSAIDGRTDVYSLACVVYEMLVGQPPFSGVSGGAIGARHLSDPMPSVRTVRPTVPIAVERALARALAKVPADRIQTPAAFRSDLLASAAPPPRPRRFGRGMLAGALLVGLLGVTSYLLRPSGRRDLLAIAVEGVAADASDPVLTRQLADRVSRQLAALQSITVFDTVAQPVGTVVRIAATGPADSVVVTARVIDQATDQLLSIQSWSPGSMAPETPDAIALQVSAFVRRKIGEVLELREAVSSLRNRAARAAVLEAESHYQKGREAYLGLNAAQARVEFELADTRLAEASGLDLSRALPWIRRGWISYNLSFFNLDDPGLVAARLDQGIAFADSALAREPRSAEAFALRGSLAEHLAFMLPGRAKSVVRRAESDLRAALAADPTLGAANVHLSRLYRRTGRMDEAVTAALAARSFDDFLLDGHGVATELFVLFRERGLGDEARRVCEEGRLLYATVVFAECRLVCLGYFGATRAAADTAVQELGAIERPGGGAEPATAGFRRVMLAAVLARAGMTDSAFAVIHQARRAGSPGMDYYESYVWAVLGDTNGTIRILAPIVAQDSTYRSLLRTSFWFRSLREQPAFRRLAGLEPLP
jgi:serine/threonine-protein kinase